MSKKVKVSLFLISTFIVFCFGLKFYLDKTYLNQFEREAIVGEDRYETMVKVSRKRWKKVEFLFFETFYSSHMYYSNHFFSKPWIKPLTSAEHISPPMTLLR